MKRELAIRNVFVFIVLVGLVILYVDFLYASTIKNDSLDKSNTEFKNDISKQIAELQYQLDKKTTSAIVRDYQIWQNTLNLTFRSANSRVLQSAETQLDCLFRQQDLVAADFKINIFIFEWNTNYVVFNLYNESYTCYQKDEIGKMPMQVDCSIVCTDVANDSVTYNQTVYIL